MLSDSRLFSFPVYKILRVHSSVQTGKIYKKRMSFPHCPNEQWLIKRVTQVAHGVIVKRRDHLPRSHFRTLDLYAVPVYTVTHNVWNFCFMLYIVKERTPTFFFSLRKQINLTYICHKTIGELKHRTYVQACCS